MKILAQFRTNSWLDREYLQNTQEIVNQKTAMHTMDIPTQANLIQCTSVHEQQKIGLEF